MADEWGRKETVMWPPHQPLYSYSAFAGALVLLLLFGWQHTHFALTPLQRVYLSMYAKTDATGALGVHGKHRLLWVSGPHVTAAPAIDLAVEPGQTLIEQGSTIPLELSPAAKAAGLSRLYLSPQMKYADAGLHAWLRSVIYRGRDLSSLYVVPFIEAGGCLLLFLCLAAPADARRFRQMKYGRLLKGPVMLSPKAFNERMKA
jgi:hypothetical protein